MILTMFTLKIMLSIDINWRRKDVYINFSLWVTWYLSDIFVVLWMEMAPWLIRKSTVGRCGLCWSGRGLAGGSMSLWVGFESQKLKPDPVIWARFCYPTRAVFLIDWEDHSGCRTFSVSSSYLAPFHSSLITPGRLTDLKNQECLKRVTII